MKKLTAIILTLTLVFSCLLTTAVADDKAAETGTTFTANDIYCTTEPLSSVPLTWEVDIKTDTGAVGTIVGNYKANEEDSVNLRINKNGNPELFITDGTAFKTFVFDEVQLIGLGRVHLTVTYDINKNLARCYLNGFIKQTVITVDKEIWRGGSTPLTVGSGTKEDPYLITNGAELWYALVSTATLGAGKYYRITNDIYLNDVFAPNWETSASNITWRTGTAFSGHLDGDGHVIYGIWYGSNSYWAGLVPYMEGGSIKNLGIAKSQILGTHAGAFVGQSVPTADILIDGCFSDDTVNIVGERNASGIVGYVQNNDKIPVVKVTNCYSKAIVTGAGTHNGILGAWNANYAINGCYTYGSAVYNGATSFSGDEAIFDNYATTGFAGTIISADQMLGVAAKTNMAALDFARYFETVDGDTPKLKAFKNCKVGTPIMWDGSSKAPTTGDGSENNPYLITNGAELWYVLGSTAVYGADKYYKITNDIYLNDVTDDNWAQSSSNRPWRTGTAFSGHLDGDGHVIYGIWYGSNSYWAGLVPYMEGGSIKNLGIAKSQILGTHAGAFVGQSVPTADILIDGCFSDDTVNIVGERNASGIVGYVQNNDKIPVVKVTNCYSKAIVTGAGTHNGILGAWNANYAINGCYTYGSAVYNGATSFSGDEAIFDNYATTGFAGTIISQSAMLGSVAEVNMSALNFGKYFETVSGNTPKLKAFENYSGNPVITVNPQVDCIFAVGGDLIEGNHNYLKNTELYSITLFKDIRTDSEIAQDAVTIPVSATELLVCYDMSNINDALTDLSGNGNHLTYYDAAKIGNYIVENNTGALNRIPYNNDNIRVDLAVGLWATPVVMDLNEDGNMDLLVSGNGGPYNGVYVFYGSKASQDKNSADYLFMDMGRYLTRGRGNLAGSYLYDESGEYSDTILSAETNVFSDFRTNQNNTFTIPNLTLPSTIDGAIANDPYHNFYSFADIDGDGLQDMIRSYSSWREYGWAGKFTPEGEWGTDGDGDPLHAWILWAENTSENNVKNATYGELKPIKVKHEDGTIKALDIYGTSSSARFVDVDKDGDLDIFYSSAIDDIYYFENISDVKNSNLNSTGEFLCAEGKAIKLAEGKKTTGLQNLQTESFFPVVADFDWNGDGYVDLIVGEEDGRVSLIENAGFLDENETPVFYAPKYFKTKANAVKDGSFATPYSIDWDGDGDEDMLVGNATGFISFIENITPAGADLTNPSWNAPVRLTDDAGKVIRHQAGYIGAVQGPAEEKNGYTVFSVVDWDNDGTLDIVTNDVWGKVVWYKGIDGETLMVESARTVEVEWTNGAKYPAHNWWKPEGNELVTYWRTTPYAIDLYGDGLMDLVMCDYEGYMAYYERYDDNGVLKLKEGRRIFFDEAQNPIVLATGTGLANGTNRQKFVLVDWNNDGKLDFIRNDATSIRYYMNVSETGSDFIFRESGTMFDRYIAYHTTSPTVCDWDNDGLPELIVGAEDGHYYYLNRKNATTIGDSNCDGEMDICDAVAVALKINNGVSANVVTDDTNRDGVFDVLDLTEIRKVIITSTGSKSTPIPTKNTLALSEQFGDNMVLQRDESICVYGTGKGTGRITVGDQVKTVTSESDSWEVYFEPMTASATPVTFKTEFSGVTKEYENVLIGDVYIASGQSNMEMTLGATEQSGTIAESSLLRLRNINDPDWYEFIKTDSWSIENTSAIGTLFAQELSVALDNEIPVGIISVSVGASRIEDWTHKDYCYCDEYDLDNTAHSDYTFYDRGHHDLYTAHIEPIEKMTTAGVLWYQGESNRGAGEAYHYFDMFKTMVDCWRTRMDDPDLPFYTVQIMLFSEDTAVDVSGNAVDEYNIRIAQGEAARTMDNVTVCTMLSYEDTLTNTGVLDIHPTDKAPIAKALANAVLTNYYNPKGEYDGTPEYSGPLYDTVTVDGNTATVTFTHVAEGLMLTKGDTVSEIEVRDVDGSWATATGTLSGNTVTVTADVDEITGVRMGYRNRPILNLYNTVDDVRGYCASPFVWIAH